MEKRERLQISRRLQAVAGLASTGMVLADVGCDHGYIPIYLLLKKRIPRAIAMDVNQGPLLRAEEHIRAWGLEKYIETRLSDGLCALAPGEAQCIVIAGMGGPLMEKILTEGEDRAKAARELIETADMQPGQIPQISVRKRLLYFGGNHDPGRRQILSYDESSLRRNEI